MLTIKLITLFLLLTLPAKGAEMNSGKMNGWGLTEGEIESLPFGCESFKTFPSKWDKKWIGDDTLMNRPSKCFSEINRVDTISKPKIKTYKVINIENEAICSCLNSYHADALLTSFRYRLPDIDNIEVYYTFNSNLNHHDECDFYYSEIGSLVLLDTNTLHAEVLPIFLHTTQEYVGLNVRFFYFSSYDKISIWQFYIGELHVTLTSKYEINVLSGKIEIETINDKE